MIIKNEGLPSKQEFVKQILCMPMEECIVRRRYCPYVYREDHERYCYAGDTPHRIIDMTDCPIGLTKRRNNGNTEAV